MKNYDLVVIGGGPGGYTAAISAAQKGLCVALVEKNKVGGTCLNRGCIPTKALLRSARIFKETGELTKEGILCESFTYDEKRIGENKDQTVEKLRSGVEFLLKSNKVDVFAKEARFLDKNTLQVGEEEISADKFLIAAGSKPVKLPIEGISLEGVLSSDDILTKEFYVPKSMVIVGGGVIGCEFATVFSSFGCDVTILEGTGQIIPPADSDLSKYLAMTLKKSGVKIHTSAKVTRIQKNDEGLTVCFEEKEEQKTVVGEKVLVSVGRESDISSLALEKCGVETERGSIKVDKNFQTSNENIYAIGDCIGGIRLAHVASAEGICAVSAMTGRKMEIDLRTVPSCIYTDPEIAFVGLGEDEAKKQGISYRVGKFQMAANGKSVVDKKDRGFIKLLFSEEDKIIGAALFCERATDLVSELSLAISNQMARSDIKSVIHPHPTFSEGILEACEDVSGEAIHIAPKRR